MGQIKIGDEELYYESHGQGRPLVLIRGVGSNADHWYAQTPALSRQHQVITFDNRGIGRTTNDGGDFTIADMAEDTLGLIKGLGLQRPHVLGLSMGGMIAQELAITHPEAVGGLVLAVTHCGGKQMAPPSPEVLALFLGMAQSGSDEAKRQAAACLFAPQTLSQHPEIAARYAKVSQAHPAGPEILMRQLKAVAGHAVFDRLERITAPTLVMSAEQDVLVPPDNARILAKAIKGAELVIVPGGGHQVFIEQAEACNRAILDFLGRMDAAQ